MLRITHNLVVAGVVGLLAVPCCAAQSQNSAAPLPAFEVASVKLSPPDRQGWAFSPPGAARFTATNATLMLLIQLAFGVDQNRVSGGPDWIRSQCYDIAAKVEGETGPTREQLKPMLQRLLAERLHLAVHRETKDVSGYMLVIAKNGPRLQAGKEDTARSSNILRDGLQSANASMKTLAAMLTFSVGQPVVDKTGLNGNYDIKLSFAPEGSMDSALPSLFTAVQEQLGLRLEPQKVPVEMLVIDYVEKVPTEN